MTDLSQRMKYDLLFNYASTAPVISGNEQIYFVVSHIHHQLGASELDEHALLVSSNRFR